MARFTSIAGSRRRVPTPYDLRSAFISAVFPKVSSINGSVPTRVLTSLQVLELNALSARKQNGGKLLSREEEFFLFGLLSKARKRLGALKRARANGDAEALERERVFLENISKAIVSIIVICNQGIVHKIAGAISWSRHGSLEFDDLVQIGNEALVKKAIPKFDHTRGIKFITYAIWWLRQSMERTISYEGRTAKIPAHVNPRTQKIAGFSAFFYTTCGRNPSVEEISEGTSLSKKQVEGALNAIALNRTGKNPEADELTLHNAPSGEESQLETLLRSEQSASVVRLVERLPPKQQAVVNRRFGLNGFQAQTLQEVGDFLGVSRERVRQVESAALRMLARWIEENRV